MTDELVSLALKHARRQGMNATAFAPLEISRIERPGPPEFHVGQPVLCFPLQGRKRLTVGEETFVYEPGSCFVASVSVPCVGEVTEASSRTPYLCLVLQLDPGAIYDVVSALPSRGASPRRDGVFIDKARPELRDAFHRLLRSLDDGDDVAVLAPLVVREVVYRLLTSRFATQVRELGVAGSHTQRIGHAIERIRTGFRRPLRIAELAKASQMSVASFHEHFRRATLMSPLQFQKQLRLHEARRLLIAGARDAASAAYEVGYSSPSQFSREYARLFGLPPRTEVREFTHSPGHASLRSRSRRA